MKRDLKIVEFVNNRHDLRKRTDVRRARVKRFRIETAVVRLIKLGFITGNIMMLLSCFIIGNEDPSVQIPWGLVTIGFMLVFINGILLRGIEE